MEKVDRTSLVSGKMHTEIKSILSNLRILGATISRKVVIAVGNDVLSVLCPEKMTKNGGTIALSNWARNVLRLLDWLKQRGKHQKRRLIQFYMRNRHLLEQEK